MNNDKHHSRSLEQEQFLPSWPESNYTSVAGRSRNPEGTIFPMREFPRLPVSAVCAASIGSQCCLASVVGEEHQRVAWLS